MSAMAYGWIALSVSLGYTANARLAESEWAKFCGYALAVGATVVGMVFFVEALLS